MFPPMQVSVSDAKPILTDLVRRNPGVRRGLIVRLSALASARALPPPAEDPLYDPATGLPR